MDIDVDLRKEEQDIDDFDAYRVIDIWKTSSTYDEFCIKCDMQDIECIITREEFEAIKHRSILCSSRALRKMLL